MEKLLAAVLVGAVGACVPAASEVPAELQNRADMLNQEGAQDHLIYRPDQIEWQPGPASFEAGSEAAVLEGDPGEAGFFNLRIRMPDGFVIAPHWHAGVERVTVVSGTFNLGMGETFDRDAAVRLPAGSYFSLPPGMRHYAFTEGETVIQLTSMGPWEITYVNPADDPRER